MITDEVSCPLYGGNVNNLLVGDSLTSLDMCNPTLQAKDEFNGHVAIGVVHTAGDGQTVSSFNQSAAAETLWGAFTSPAGLPNSGKRAVHCGIARCLGTCSEALGGGVSVRRCMCVAV